MEARAEAEEYWNEVGDQAKDFSRVVDQGASDAYADATEARRTPRMPPTLHIKHQGTLHIKHFKKKGHFAYNALNNKDTSHIKPLK